MTPDIMDMTDQTVRPACSSSDSMRAFMGLIPDPVAKSKHVGWPAAGARSMRKPLPMTGDTNTSAPAMQHILKSSQSFYLVSLHSRHAELVCSNCHEE